MRFKFAGFIGLFVLLSSYDSGNGISILNFDEFEPHLHYTNDTTYIINFWATWCIPCRKEIPDFEKISSQYSGDNVKVLLVSLDMSENLGKTLIPFIEKYNLKSEVLVLDDPNSNTWINKVDPSWSGTIPATLIYNRQYREFFPYPLTYEKLNSIVKLNYSKP